MRFPAMWLCGVAAALLSGCVSTVSGNAVREQPFGGSDVPPLGVSKLDGVMLSVGELNGIVGSTQMKVAIELQQMNDHSAA
ncbi:MAG TPA: sensor domain-containing protein, partial [Mycobacterium sp.]|nr:sensor domain-containing protein [Mycobacterium sp.]